LLHLATHLDRFDGRSAFTTWVYRVATNKFLSAARSRAEEAAIPLEDFMADLAHVPLGAQRVDLDRELLAEEVKIGCILAMLLCLDRETRMAYVVGAIAEIDHRAAAEILGCRPAAFRKRLERGRTAITGLMRRRCGVFDERNACRCDARIETAIERGRVDPTRLVFATSREQARRFPRVLDEIRRLEDVQRAAAIYRSHPEPAAREQLTELLDGLLAARTGRKEIDRRATPQG
jgi:DNA-directed RNA polymerase specialized sigma24 family protein